MLKQRGGWKLNNEVITIFISGYYERNSSGLVTKYYGLAGSVSAMRREGSGANPGLFWVLGDHLGSASVILKADGSPQELTKYTPWGGLRTGSVQLTLTIKGYTGQYREDSLGLYFYNARWLDVALGRFIQVDSIVPDMFWPGDFDRFSYVRNNTIRYVDPSGHFTDDAIMDYLKGVYEDEWERYWKLWKNDKEWIKLLHAAQAGDILTRLYDNKVEFYKFSGKGEEFLGGIDLLDNSSGKSIGVGDLISIYGNQGNGIGIIGFDKNNNMIVKGIKGNISIQIQVFTQDDVDTNNALMTVAMSAATYALTQGLKSELNQVLISWGSGGVLSRFNTYINAQIGNQVGDNRLTIGASEGPQISCYNSTFPSVYWGYEGTWRDGIPLPLTSGQYSWNLRCR